MHLQNGNTVEIEASKNSKENIFINKITKNGKKYSKSYITFDDLMKGSNFSFDMIDKPNKKLNTTKSSKPYSMSSENN